MEELQAPNDNFDPLAGIQKNINLKDPVLNSGYQNAVGRPNPYATLSDPLATGITSTSADPDKLFKNQLQQKMDAASINASRSPKLASLFQYGGKDLSGQSFERYYALGDVKNKLGFNPFRDNESLYNANTSVFDDWKRMMTRSFMPLATRGAIDAFMSIPDLLSSSNKPLGNIDQAEEYEKATEIGYSSRGGMLSSLSNIQMSFAYTVGIAAESIAEASLITAATQGLGAVPAAVRSGSKIVSSVGDIYGAINKTRKALQALSKNPLRAKTFWKAAGNDFVNFANPLRQTTEAFLDLRKSKNLTSLAKVAKTAGAFYRDVKEVSVALSESNLEGGFVNNEVYKSLYASELEKNNNQPLSDGKVKKIYQQATAAGNEAGLLNWPIIYLSNRITIGNAFRGFRPIRELTEDVVKRKGGYLNVIRGKGKAPKVEWVKDSFLPKISLKEGRKTLLSGLKYTSANFMEGFQEVFQEAVAIGAKEHYINAFNNPVAANFLAHKAAYIHGAKEQLSGQGLETFLSGFLIGAHMKPINMAIAKAPIAYNYFFDKTEYANYLKAREEYGPKLAKTLTDMMQDVDVMFDSRFFNVAAQDEFARGMDDAQLRNDEWKHKNERDAARAHGILTAINTGTLDYYLENLDTIEELEAQDIADAYNVTLEKAQRMKQEVPEFKKKVAAIRERHKYMTENFELPAEASTEGMIKDSPEYIKAKLKENAYHQTILNAVFNGSIFDAQLERKERLYAEAMAVDSPIGGGANSLFTMLFNPENSENEILLLQQEIDILKKSTKESDKKILSEKEDLLKTLTGTVFDIGVFGVPIKGSLIDMLTRLNNFDKYSDREIKLLRKSAIYQNATSAVKRNLTRKKNAKIKAEQQALRGRVHTKTKELLGKLSRQSGTKLDNQKVMEFIDKLLDYHTISSNERFMQQYIDAMFDPASLEEQYSRNFLIMQDLYNNKKTYADTIVNNFLKSHEKNATLNYLADKFQIYVDAEQFTNYVNSPPGKKVPIEFIDARRGVQVTEESLEYENYIEVLNIARELNNSEAVPAEDRGETPDITDEERNFANNTVSDVSGVVDSTFAFSPDVLTARENLSKNLNCK